MPEHFDCAVIGSWHLAFVTAACLAKLGHATLLVDPADDRMHSKQFPPLPLDEKGLHDLIEDCRARGLLQSSGGISSGWTADFVWLGIDTPVGEDDQPDTSPLLEAARQVAERGCCRKVLVVTSQVPLGFCVDLEHRLGLRVACVPENLQLGRSIEGFLSPDRKVIGASTPATCDAVLQSLDGVTGTVVRCDLSTAEMIKHATNAFLATSISFANELARIGETVGVDGQLVGRALKLDQRIGRSAYVAPGLGFAGGTLPRDLRALQKHARAHHVPSRVVDAVLEVNGATTEAMLESIVRYVGDLRGKAVLIIGYTYKAETDTLRRSPAVGIARMLKAKGARVLGYDPPLNGRDRSELVGLIEHLSRWEDLKEPPDVSILLTARKEFETLDWSRFKCDGHTPTPLVLDTRGYLHPDSVSAAGFAYKALWQPFRAPRSSTGPPSGR